MDDHFTLQWNDYQSHLMSAFSSLRNDKDFVDLTLSCEGRRISSHKMLLSACSPYFRGLLKENPCPHPVIILRQTSYEDLVAIIHFVYNGEVSLHQSRVKSFIKTAKSLKIRGLCEASEFAQEDEELSHSARAGDGPNRKKMKLVEETEELEEFGVASVGSGATGRSSGTGGGGGGKEWATSFDYGTANTSNSNDLQEELGNSVMDQGSFPGGQKRRAISIETKMEIIKRKEQGERTCQIANATGIPKSTISSILKNGESIKKLSSMPSMMGAFYDTRRSRSGKMHEMERILNNWIEDQNSANGIVNGPIIQEKAREIWVDIGGPDDEESKSFVASNGWFERFRKRFNLQMVKNVSSSKDAVPKIPAT